MDADLCAVTSRELVEAEGIGRAIVERRPGCRNWVIVADGSGLGAAALAAARHAANAGASVNIFLPRFPSQPDESECFRLFREVCGRMSISMQQALPVSVDEDSIVLIGMDPSREYDGNVAEYFNAVGEVAFVGAFSVRDAWSVGRDSLFVCRMLDDDVCLPAADVRAIDGAAINEFALPGLCLMENAAIGAVAVAKPLIKASENRPIVALCGSGNNGGDGLAAARGLLHLGLPVRSVVLAGLDRLTGDAAANYRMLYDMGGDVLTLESPEEIANFLPEMCRDASLILDGIVGTGLSGPVRGAALAAITAVNSGATPVLALDIPSGLHADSGEVLGCAIRAEATVTFAAGKKGLFTGAGRELSGDVFLAGIGAPNTLLSRGGLSR